MHELVLRVGEEQVEAVSQALVEQLDALSVSVEDADAGTAAELPLFGEPGLPAPGGAWQRSTLRALFDDEHAADRAAAWLLAHDAAQPHEPTTGRCRVGSPLRGADDGSHRPGGGLQLQSSTPVADVDWVRLTQAQFAPVAITPQFWIVPSWHEAPAAARRVIRLDPGLAFGTGTHPTTRMCLRWLASHAAAWPRVLDYGCGSGILAIGAALFGARQIDAVDIDATAITATRDNARVNQVELQAGTPELAQGEYPLVLANILATPLKLLAPLLCAHLSPRGQLVLAGILDRQADELCDAYAPFLALSVHDAEEGWILMTGQRR